MSKFEVVLTKVKIVDHPHADRLQIAVLFGEGGYNCVVGLNQFEDGELAIYIPPGSVVSDAIAEHLSKNKITMKNNRIRAIKIRDVLSEGLCLKPSDWLADKDIVENKDVKDLLGIKKYEPPVYGSRFAIFKAGNKVSLHYENDNFVKYDCISHFKKYPQVIEEGEQVVITKKLHGTSHRAGLVMKSYSHFTWWDKVKSKLFGSEPVEFLVGSHNAIRFPKKDADVDGDLYLRIAKDYNLEHITKEIAKLLKYKEVVVYGEVIGSKIQKGYCYGHEANQTSLRVFDIMADKKFLSWSSVVELCERFDLPTVEKVYVGPWSLDLLKHAEAVDEYNGKKYVREGIVIKTAVERKAKCGRVALKYLSAKYLLDGKNTEFH